MNPTSPDRYAGLLVANPLLTTAEAEARLKKVMEHGERHARRPLVPSDTTPPRTVPIPPRRRRESFARR